MKDLLGKTINIGDFVIVTKKNYHDMVIAIVLKVNNKKISVQYWENSGLVIYLTEYFTKINDNEISLIPQEILDKIDIHGNNQFKKFIKNANDSLKGKNENQTEY